MPGKKADAEAFASRWANKGNENQDTQRFWIDFYQNVLGVEDAVSRLEFEKPVSTDASTHEGSSTSSSRRQKPSSSRSRLGSTSLRRRRARAAR